MKRIRFFLTLLAVCAATALGVEETLDFTDSSSVAKHDSGAIVARDSLKVPRPSAFNPAIALTSSIIIPGAGQAYTRHYVKAGLFLVAEAGVGIFGYQQYVWQKERDYNADSVGALAARLGSGPVVDTMTKDTTYPGIPFQLEADRDRFDAKAFRYNVYQSITWMAGIYYYNALDALQATGIFKNDSKKDPSLAGWLSAIPALGLGQFYNGEAGKAGMIFMTQFNLGFLVINYQMLMKDCEKYELSMVPGTPQYSVYTANGFNNDWESRRNQAFRNRNMYLWYSLMFYFYGVLDAVVDAHLHDAGVKMKLEPDLVPQNKQVGMTMTVPF
jgi:TM2 domain-containing membrane protein YozV